MVKGLFVLGLFLFLAGIAGLSIFILTLDIPSAAELREREVVQSTKIFDRTGETLLFEIFNEEKRTVINFDHIPREIKNATIAIEDANFYNHHGISPFSIFRAFITDLMRGRILVQGGSTITQQLVKNTLLSPEKTITRKLKEAVLALKIERTNTKDEILNMYLNEISYGSNAYGVEAASQIFFGKSAEDVTLAEAAYLAALPQAPSYFSPYGTHTRELEARKNTVLNRMAELGYITEEDRDSAKEETIAFLPVAEHGIRAPHFVMDVINQLHELYGEEFIKKTGLQVITTLNIDYQQHAEETIAEYAETIDNDFGASNTGIIAIDPKTGEVLAMVGSRDYFNREDEGNFNITTALRQPGSAFKPIVYASALEQGYTPETIVFDVQTEFASAGAESYRPGNYDGTFHGPMTLREALAQSVNIPAVKVLYLTGIKKALETASRLGITTLEGQNRYGLTLVLGGGEVQLLELASVYGVFANDGVRNEPAMILHIEQNNGDMLFDYEPTPRPVLDTQIARRITDILSDNAARTPAFGSQSALYFSTRPVAAKTGTTNDFRDAWILGYTPNIVAGVWAGNNDNSPMEKKVAGFIVAPIWHDFLERVFETLPPEDFVPPEREDVTKPFLMGEWRGGVTYEIDTVSGKRATDATPEEFREIRVVPELHSILHWVNKSDPRGPIPEFPERDAQYKNWEEGVKAWAVQNNIDITGEPNNIPTEFDDVHTEENKPHIIIVHPQDGATYQRSLPLTITLSTKGTYPIKQADYFLNGQFMGSDKGIGSFSVDFSSLTPDQKNAILLIKVYDNVGNVEEKEVKFKVE